MSTNIYQPRHPTIGMNAQSGNVGMMNAIYVNTNESLAVGVVSSIGGNVNGYDIVDMPYPPPYEGVTVGIDVRILTANNGLQYLTFLVVPTADYRWNQFNIKLPEGFLLNASAYTQGNFQQAPFPGQGSIEQRPTLFQTWVSLSLVVTLQPNQFTSTFLCQGYVTNNQRVTYPTAQPLSYQGGVTKVWYTPGTNVSGPGTITVTFAPFLNTAIQVLGIQIGVAVSSTGSNNRTLVISVQDLQGYTNVAPISATFVLAAWAITPGTTSTYVVGAGLANTELYQESGLLRDLYLRRPQSILVSLGGSQTGDNLSNFTVIYREWLVP